MPDLATIAALLNRVVVALESPPAEGLAAEDAARLVGVSVSKWHAMNAGGQCPAPAELGDRCPRWSRGELIQWIRAGAPARSRWQLMRDVAMRRAG